MWQFKCYCSSIRDRPGKRGSWIQVELSETVSMHGFEILWVNGSTGGFGNINHYKAAIHDSDNPTSGEQVNLAITGAKEEIFYVDEPVNQGGRYLRLTFDHNQLPDHFSIISRKVLGKKL